MREGWKEVTIGDLGQVVTGNTPPRKNPEYYGEHTLFVKPTDVSEGEKYTYYPEECYSELGFKKYIKSLIPKGSTCVVTIGSIGKKMTKAHCDLFINQAMNAVIPNDNFDEEFVYYVLKFNLSQLKTFDSGTASGRENVSKSSFSNIKIKVPIDKNVQRKIGEILSAYDDLIENNLKRIKILEEMAQQTYEEWFVRMRFPGHQSATMNPETGLPEGWEKVKLSSIYELKYGKNLPQTQILQAGAFNVYGASGKMGFYDKNNVNDKKVLVTSRGNGSGVVHRTHENKSFVTNNSFIVNSKFKLGYTYYNLKHFDLSRFNSGSAQPQLTNSALDNVEIILPNVDIIFAFDENTCKSFELIDNLLIQNQRLREARDILLPRLMMGMVEV
jgi:type I restriction enzyme S subunit